MKLRSYDDVQRLNAYLQTIADWREGYEKRARRAQQRLETGTIDWAEHDALIEEGRAIILLMGRLFRERRVA